MEPNRFAPPLADVRDPPAHVPGSFGTGQLVGELANVVENAMARFDAIAGAKPPSRGGGISGAAQRDLARQSSNRVLLNVFGIMAFLVIVFFLKPSFAVTGAVSCVILAFTGVTIFRQHRNAPVKLQKSVGRMPEPLGAVAAQVAAVRLSLPPSHERLAEAIETIESRMARIFNGGREDLATALLKLTGKSFGYGGFAELATREPQVAIALERLRMLVAQALDVAAVAA